MLEETRLTVADRHDCHVSIRDLCKSYGNVLAIKNVTIEVNPGEFLALLGPSGSGKTTLLMAVAGFDFPDSGGIEIGGQDVTWMPPHKRDLGMVFQRYTLFPHMSVLDNIAFPLRMRKVGRAAREERARAALTTVRLDGYGDRTPAQLSGGQQQRVALARAIVYNPKVLLMDEPLSALDKKLREEMQVEIKHLQRELGITVIFVTHDQTAQIAIRPEHIRLEASTSGMTATVDDAIYAGSVTTLLVKTRGPTLRVRLALSGEPADATPGGVLSLAWEARHARAYAAS